MDDQDALATRRVAIFSRVFSIIYLPLVTNLYSLGMSRLFDAPLDKQLSTRCGLLAELPLWLDMLLPVSALRETLGNFSKSLSTTKVTTWSKTGKQRTQNLQKPHEWVIPTVTCLPRQFCSGSPQPVGRKNLGN